jgi:hypothetical protein
MTKRVLLAAGGYAAYATHDTGIQKQFVNQQKLIE